MKWLRILLVIILSISAGVGGAYWRLRDFITPDQETIKETISFNEASGTINVLIAGVDMVDGSQRSDSIALAVVDIDKKSIRLMSIPRDTRVLIPGRGWQKINHSYAYGGIQLLQEVVINLLGVPVNYYVVVNFSGFPAIIDLIGGVTIDVEKKLVYNDYSGKLFINIPKGVQTLNGKAALEYVRFRNDPLGDIGRVARQQKFTKELLKKLQSPAILPKLPELARKVVNMVNTNMSPAQAIQLASYLEVVSDKKLDFFMMPGKAGYVGELSYWLPDIPAASMLLAGEEDSSITVSDDTVSSREEVDNNTIELVEKIKKIAILNGDGSKGLSKQASEAMQRIGVDVGYTGNAKHFDYHSTIITIPNNATEAETEAAQALAKLCGIRTSLITHSGSSSMVTLIFGHDKDKIFERLQELGIH